jgi:hypothetical protein
MPELKTLEAPAYVAAEKGEFTALAATWTVDRQHEQIRKGAFASTAARWRQSGKRIPLSWGHQTTAEAIIGSVDPSSMTETGEGLLVSGKLDISDSEKAREAWRSVKSRAVSLSFGFLVLKSHKRDDGIRELTELDLYEVSLTPTPANQDTRILETKSMPPVSIVSFDA